ncbi:hypothetical protein MVEN_00182300 [Mycena venus]|uniref:Uncharacterized protein n=1 Tax=Mycena venus TaxID=2733690 RepID=A0A8H6Z2B0_9AGAR|nr:hypothetical protein MVEN_00182300 [Mycena venus]
MHPVLEFLLLTEFVGGWPITIDWSEEQQVQCGNFKVEMAGTDDTAPYKLLLVPDSLSPAARIHSCNFSEGEDIVVYEEFTSITFIRAKGQVTAACLCPGINPFSNPTPQRLLLPRAFQSAYGGIPIAGSVTLHFLGFIPAPPDDALHGLFNFPQGSSQPEVYFDLPLSNITDISGQGRGYDWIRQQRRTGWQ